VTELVVTDSTCLIGLERIGLLDLLLALFETIIAPPAVAQEFGTALSWLQIETPTDQGMVAALNLLVDAGEAEAIALAYERKLQIILDDRQARSVAQRLGLSIIGTVAVLIKAKQTNQIPALKPALDSLEQHGFYLSEALKSEALKLVGE